MMDMDMTTWETRRELAARLQVSVKTVDNWRKAGKIPALKVGRSVRFDPAEVDAALRGAA